MSDKGILLIAADNKKYLHMACNLSASIRQSNEKVPIALYYDKESNIEERIEELSFVDGLFDIIHPINNKHFKYGGQKEVGYLKNNVYNFSPFKKTLYIDVDSLIFRDNNISDLFSLVNSRSFCFPHTLVKSYGSLRSGDNSLDWFDFSDIEPFLSPKLNAVNELKSYFFLFKKCKETSTFFERVNYYFKKMYDGKIQQTFDWHHSVSDEPVFILALHDDKEWKDFTIKNNYMFNHFNGNTTKNVRKKYYGVTYSGVKISSEHIFEYENCNRRNFDNLSIPYDTKLKYNFVNFD